MTRKGKQKTEPGLCPKCGVKVNKMIRHINAKRCNHQHIRQHLR